MPVSQPYKTQQTDQAKAILNRRATYISFPNVAQQSLTRCRLARRDYAIQGMSGSWKAEGCGCWLRYEPCGSEIFRTVE